MTERRRTSVRQAIVLIALPRQPEALRLANGNAELAHAIADCAWLDAVRAVAGINGVTVTTVVERAADLIAVESAVPPGVDLALIGHPDQPLSERIGLAMQEHIDRSFARVVVVPCAGPAIPARTVATALSTLASADLVLGPTPSGGCYLIGASAGGAIPAIAGAGDPDLTAGALQARAAAMRLSIRSLEPHPTFASLPNAAALQNAIKRGGTPSPCLAALLTRGDRPATSA